MDSELSISDSLRSKAVKNPGKALRLNKRIVNASIAHPEIVFENSSRMILGKSSLGDDSWTNIEHMVFSAIKLGRENWVGYGLRVLREKFPNSTRVKRLSGLFKESKQEWSEAEDIYKEMLIEDAHDLYSRKRLIACLKAQSRSQDAISAIQDQLEVFSSDIDLWHELSMLYVRECAFSKALVPFEEVLLSNPTSFYNLVVYADILGSSGKWEMARKFYCKALHYRPNEIRVLYGLLNALVSSPVTDKKTHEALLTETKNRLMGLYEHSTNHSSKLAIRMISRIESE